MKMRILDTVVEPSPCQNLTRRDEISRSTKPHNSATDF
jgi:hypothetical protein